MRWKALQESDSSADLSYVKIRNQWMTEYYDAEPEDVKAEVDKKRALYNDQLEASLEEVDWSALDSQIFSTSSAESATSHSQTSQSESQPSSTGDGSSSTPAVTSNPSTSATSAPQSSTESSEDSATSVPETDRLQQLIVRQR